MTADDFSLVEAIFAEALPLAADQRARVLHERCRGRTDLLHEVATLLQAHDVVAQSSDDEGRTAVHCGVGDRTGAYRLTELIGEGGMGVVFAAERADGAFVQKAAVKLTRSVLADPELQRRFKIERQILASLRHPNIVTLLDGGATPDGRGYLVMEYVEGLPLTQYCRDRALPLEERLNIFRDVCAAVQFAHQHGIVHRDLKPSNILVGADGVPKVLDFGVAKLLAPSVATDATIGIVPGLLTPNYASPEQLRGLPVTTTSDVYALGVVLYELLAGTRPYETAGQLLDRVMELVLHAPPVPPSEVRPDVAAGVPYPRARLRGDLDAIVLKAMSKDTTHRYGSAGELASDIDRYLAGAPVLARAPSTAYVLRRLAARNKPLVTLGALALAAILIILGVALRQAQIARAERDRAQAEAAKAQQMAALLGGIFQSANPTQVPGEPVTARDLLDRATTSIANELEDQPDVHASLLLIMSDAYDRLTMEPTALELAQRSLRLREQALPAESLEVAESLHKVGRLHRRRRQTAQALPLLQRALALRETLLGYEHREVASTLREVGLAQLDVADWTGGRQTLERAIRIEERVAPQSASLALLYNNLGNCLVAAGDWTSARPAFEHSIAVYDKVEGPDRWGVAMPLLSLGMLLRLQEEFAGARPLFERALRIDDETFGSDSGASGYALARLGDLSHAEGLLDTAQAQLDRALTLISRHYGADHPEMVTVLTYSGRLLRSRSAPRQALSVFERALRLGEQIYGEHPRVAEVLVDLARTRLALNEPAAAESLLRRALAIQRRTLPARHPSFVATLTLLGQGEHAAPDRPERLKLLEEAVDTARHALAPSHSARRTAEDALSRAQPASVPQPASVR